MRVKTLFVAGVCVLLLSAGSAWAAADEQPAPPAAASAAAPCSVNNGAGPAAGGMIVGRDPETGELGLPSPEQRRELLAKEMGAAALVGKSLFEVALPGIGFKIDLQGLLQDYAVVGIGPDGKPHVSCLHEASDVQRFLGGAAAPISLPPQPEEE